MLHRENAPAEVGERYAAMRRRSSGGSLPRVEESMVGFLGQTASLARERRTSGKSQIVEDIVPNWIGG